MMPLLKTFFDASIVRGVCLLVAEIWRDKIADMRGISNWVDPIAFCVDRIRHQPQRFRPSAGFEILLAHPRVD